MPDNHFEAKVRQEADMAVIDLQGEVDAFAQAGLEAAYAAAAQEDPPNVLLNFEAVDYINSTGIALIVGILAKARAAGRQVLACGLSEHYEEIFSITRLADFMCIFPDEVSAVAGRP